MRRLSLKGNLAPPISLLNFVGTSRHTKYTTHIFIFFSINFSQGNCANGKSDSNGPSLDMDSFGGIYLILCGGVGLALGVALCEFCGKPDDSTRACRLILVF